jgi:hypothetical protein
LTSDTRESRVEALSPLRVRLAVFAAMAAVAVASIWWIDRRAMEIQARHGWSQQVER